MIVKQATVTIFAPEGFEVDGIRADDLSLALRIFQMMGFPDKAPPSSGACFVEVNTHDDMGRTVAGRYYQSVYGR